MIITHFTKIQQINRGQHCHVTKSPKLGSMKNINLRETNEKCKKIEEKTYLEGSMTNALRELSRLFFRRYMLLTLSEIHQQLSLSL